MPSTASTATLVHRACAPSFTCYSPAKLHSQRRQRSKRFRPRGLAATHAELNPTLLLRPVESHAPSPQRIAAAPPLPAYNCAEPPLLPAESAALLAQGPIPPPLPVAPPEARLAGVHLVLREASAEIVGVYHTTVAAA